MKILTKQIVAAYANVMLDIMENNPSNENTKNIYQTLRELSIEWDNLYYNGSDSEKEIGNAIEKAAETAGMYYTAGEVIDFDNDEMFKGLIQLVQLGKED